ncbi:MAG: tRNA dihydrouridine(20/20a) synthase DusA [Neomegalonema sp.]|nr:tRNA dihydrouridine(20/20a) synthase DusA [Neomegalonema sp.]
MTISPFSPHRLSVAPMMEWTDRHCRMLHRQLSRCALLYTEMVVADGVTRGDPVRMLSFSAAERPVALQLGGSSPATLADAVRIAVPYGYDEINLNVGCPSDRVRDGSFGACLMRDPDLVARCCAAMIAASAAEGGPPITVKCRIGVDDQEPAATLPNFIDRVADAGVESFAIHARKAWLKGLSPKENRTIPPLDYDLALAMKRRRPELTVAINGGVMDLEAAATHLAAGFDGVMVGRAAYHDPVSILGSADRRLFAQDVADVSPEEAVARMRPYIAEQLARGQRLDRITRHMLGLFAGRRGARAWRRILTDQARLPGAGLEVIDRALEPLAHAAATAPNVGDPAPIEG